MWIVTQNRKHVLKVTNVWLNDEKNGICKICAGYGSTAEDELWNDIGEYKETRAREVFENIINTIGKEAKYEMPIE